MESGLCSTWERTSSFGPIACALPWFITSSRSTRGNSTWAMSDDDDDTVSLTYAEYCAGQRFLTV